jgi:hypothetical protein
MNGDALISTARRILRDEESSTQQGLEWSDREIILALNAAQHVFINFCIRNRHYYLLAPLLTESRLFNPATDGDPIDLGTHVQFTEKPFLHYSSAYVGAQQRIARFYYGGELDSMLHVNHSFSGLIKDSLYFRDGGAVSEGVLNYYKKPSYIGATSLGDNARADFTVKDFDDFIYTDIIVNHACVLLGIKEVQTQREFKKENKTISNMALYPSGIANYISDSEAPDFVTKQKQIQMARSQNG